MNRPEHRSARGPAWYPDVATLAGRVAAALLLAALSPLLLLLSAAVWVDSRGPILFRQLRSGLDGEIFAIYKFRTMRGGADGLPHLHRTTRVGRLLRRFGLDELPQLLNIVRGEMCFVGPRPTLPEQVLRYGDRERRRLEVKPGVTGWAQVNGRNALDWQARIDLDIWYIDHRSIALDVRILARTLSAMLGGSGVYGDDGRNPDFEPQNRPEQARAA